MTSTTFFIIFIPILSILLLSINLVLAPHNPYQEKDSVFECGFHSFLGQNRTQFSISFFIFALLFLLFDLEILLVYPYSVSGYNNDVYGLVIMMMFFILLTLGFVFELGKNALTIDSKQTFSYNNEDVPKPYVFITSHLRFFGLDYNLLYSKAQKRVLLFYKLFSYYLRILKDKCAPGLQEQSGWFLLLRVFKYHFLIYKKYSAWVSGGLYIIAIFTVPFLLGLELLGYIWLVFIVALSIILIAIICQDDRLITGYFDSSLIAT
jgi:NADH-ubiquinone oxidoreductase chain 3